MSTLFNSNQNQLLAELPVDIYERIFPHLELILMPLGQVLYESGRQLDYFYFPITAIVSLFYVMENGATSEITSVGNEGILGISLFMGGKSTSSLASVKIGGSGYRLKRLVMMEEFNRIGGRRAGILQKHFLLYTQTLITQISQAVVCNRFHSVEQQLCRWLLLTLDRLPGQEMTMTHELIASMIGVRREGITEAAGNLQILGLISYRRGHITVLDRLGLESTVCECYGVVKKESHRLSNE